MAQITSTMAAKYLRKLNEEHDALMQKEKKSDTYTVSVQEKPEDVRPEYDYAAVQLQLQELEDKIRKVKHAINQFNLTQDVPGFNMTIDQMLIYILNFRNFYPIQALKSSRLIQYYANTARNSLLEIESSQNNHAKNVWLFSTCLAFLIH